MNPLHLMWRMLLMVVVLVAGGASVAHAQDTTPVIVVEGSETGAPAAEGPGVNVVNPNSYYLYLSAPGSGNVAGIAYADEDILRYDPTAAQWVKVFDGTNAGLPAAADIDALAYRPVNLGASYYMSFDKPVNVPGLGMVDDSDIVVYTTVLLSNPTWSLFFVGSNHGLTTNAEDIDALEVHSATEFSLSTMGAVTVPGYYVQTLSAADEDVLRYNNNYGAFFMEFDGTLTLGLTANNDIRGTATYADAAGDLDFFTAQRAATYSGNQGSLTVAPNDIVVREESMYGSMIRYTLFFDASAAGFPKVDAFDAVHK